MSTEHAKRKEPVRVILGAEARVTIHTDRVVKERVVKAYRHPHLDQRIREERAKREERITNKAFTLGVSATRAKREGTTLTLTRVEGRSIAELENMPPGLAEWLAHALHTLHTHHIIHGDITPRNIIQKEDGRFTLIDYGLSFFSSRWEDRAYDISMIRHTFAQHPGFYEAVRDAYTRLLTPEEKEHFEARLAAILKRGRHKQKENA